MLEELRLQVDRQWDLTKFFVLLNGSVVAVAVALFQVDPAPIPLLLMGTAFLGGVAMSVAGLAVMLRSKRYYRVLVAKKTLVEARLGLTRPLAGFEADPVANLAVGALATRDKIRTILASPHAYANARISVRSATGAAGMLLLGFGLFDALGAVVSFHALAGCPWNGLACA